MRLVDTTGWMVGQGQAVLIAQERTRQKVEQEGRPVSQECVTVLGVTITEVLVRGGWHRGVRERDPNTVNEEDHVIKAGLEVELGG